MTGASPRRVLLIGGTSEIGLAIVRRLAADAPLAPYLLGRDRDRLGAALEVLRRAGCADGALATFDAADLAGNEHAVNEAFASSGGFDLVVLAVGVLGAQDGLDADPRRALEVMNVNFAGCGSLMLASLRALRAGGGGTLVVLSSVAGERVRSANAIYGATKAGLDALAQGLGDAVAGDGLRVLVVRPGFVSTRMTAGLPRAPLATTPEAVADATVKALDGSAHTVWVPGILRYVFMILRHLPRALFRRLAL
ncbi:MAG: SDR family NAD(P)-dependent oxidoreductase [Solirubrobacteraceae bacterium]